MQWQLWRNIHWVDSWTILHTFPVDSQSLCFLRHLEKIFLFYLWNDNYSVFGLADMYVRFLLTVLCELHLQWNYHDSNLVQIYHPREHFSKPQPITRLYFCSFFCLNKPQWYQSQHSQKWKNCQNLQMFQCAFTGMHRNSSSSPQCFWEILSSLHILTSRVPLTLKACNYSFPRILTNSQNL